MKRFCKRLIAGAMVGVLAFSTLPSGSMTAQAAGEVAFKNASGTIKMLVGKSYQLKTNVASSKLTFKSSNTKIAKVSAKGKIKAVKKGTAKVTAISKANKNNKATVKVKVSIPVKEVVVTKPTTHTLVLENGSSYKLKTSVTPKNAGNKKLSFTTSNKKIATISKSGKIKVKKNGTAKITVKAKDGSNKKTTLTLIVGTPVTAVALDKTTAVGEVGTSISLKATVTPDNASVKDVIWVSSDENIASVDVNGNVILKQEGTAVITAISADGNEKSAACTVSVSKKSTAVTIPETPTTTEDKTDSGEGTTEDKMGSGEGTTEDKTDSNETTTEEKTDSSEESTEGEYSLVWEEDFTGETLDTANDWTYELHDPGWVNNELQEYTKSDDNIYLEDGSLVIQALKTQVDGADYYTSGKITTQDKHEYTYGKFEIRAKVPSGQGLWPAIWMMPADESFYGQWPKCGEIDIMEILGHETNKTYATLHYGDPHCESQGTYMLEDGSTFADDYHTYTCEWLPGKINFYVDGQLIHTESSWFTRQEGFGKQTYPAPFDQPFYLQLNLAVGGTWPGNPDETTDFDNAKFYVDYVKVYQLESYDENVSAPEAREPDAEGNYIINGNFDEESLTDDAQWSFLQAADGVGSAEITNNTLTIHTETAGTQNHSIQIVQPEVPMIQGTEYTLTFDAWASADRTMIVDVSAPKNGWIRYLADTTVDLTTTKQTYTYTFEMTKEDDVFGRLEFNLGNQGSTEDVFIQNVKLVKSGSGSVDNTKDVLPDGNYVYNGEFQEGDGRLAYWEVDAMDGASVSVTNDDLVRELEVVVPDGVTDLAEVTVSQGDLMLVPNTEYAISLDAYADIAKTIQISVPGQTFDVEVDTEKKNYKFVFTTPEDMKDASVVLMLGAARTTYVDNVRLTENAMIVNGSFVNGTTGFIPYVYDAYTGTGTTPIELASYYVDNMTEGENYAMKYDINNTGDQDWHIQLKQANITLEKDKWYEVSFKIRSTMDRKVRYALQHDGNSDGDWTVHNGADISATSDYQTYTNTFKMSNDTDNLVNFTISMGKVDAQITEQHSVFIDDIVLKEVDEPEITEPDVSIEIGEELIRNGEFDEGESEWLPQVNVANAATYNFADGKLVFDIVDVGTANWAIQLKQSGLTIEKGATYALEMEITSDVSRRIEYSLMDSGSSIWYGGGTYDLTANQNVTVPGEMIIAEDAITNEDAYFILSLGKVTDGDQPGTITIESISLKKTANGTGDESSDNEETTEETPEEAPEITPEEIAGNLVQNPNFEDGMENWKKNIYGSGAATVTVGENAIVYDITNVGTADSEVQLIQSGIPLENGATYKIRFKAHSTEARAIKSIMMSTDGNYTWYGGQDVIELAKDETTSVEYTVTMTTADEAAGLYISMGMMESGDTPTSVITLSDFSIVKVAAE